PLLQEYCFDRNFLSFKKMAELAPLACIRSCLFVHYAVALGLPLTFSCMESCVFEGEDFPKENRKPANKQQPLCQLKLAIFYTRCCKYVARHLSKHVQFCFPFSNILRYVKVNRKM